MANKYLTKIAEWEPNKKNARKLAVNHGIQGALLGGFAGHIPGAIANHGRASAAGAVAAGVVGAALGARSGYKKSIRIQKDIHADQEDFNSKYKLVAIRPKK